MTFDTMFDEQADAARERIWEAILDHAKTIPVSDGGMALFITMGGALAAIGMAAAYFMDQAPKAAPEIEAGLIEQFRESIKTAIAGSGHEGAPN